MYFLTRILTLNLTKRLATVILGSRHNSARIRVYEWRCIRVE